MFLDKDLIRKSVRESGYKQKWIANEIGVSEAVFSNMLNERKNWDAITYYKYCKLFGVPFETFISNQHQSKTTA